ncbi:MAG: serine--tRNA ligase [Alphaproteobacteria bacterium]|jgi:seryl-tRNA synthetase|nr:serine--tRNA ligase [Rhodospirillaceae bacterium]MDP6021577.1 serine--tRNA ligase [Alphaproteobacteria bacterium]MDP6256473.1 serine--tRNA ligase [Alphaproteobacteria bacterium]MDP7056320.1 serine--tRNA ligase [Alphaproteobacteria bacterium]MDP7228356.1 serine--tRNA ligase [Alphaproteobacteria bacterium]|tara:strand:+ start:34 stop:1302 length:1269 start_codon:yes stop_codon:yes gene_type:complete
MYDLRWIRENPEAFDAGMAARGVAPQAADILSRDEKARANRTILQEMQNRRNALSKQIGAAKSKGEDADQLIAEVGDLKGALLSGEETERELSQSLRETLSGLPNQPEADVPMGPDEEANIEVRRHGTAPVFDFEPREHFEIGEALGLMDFEAASKLSGSRFVVLRGALARLERALSAFMLDIHSTEFGYTETSVPLLVREHTAFGTGNLPKFEEDLFKTTDGFYLIPTAEMVLTNLVRDGVLGEDELPLRYIAHTPCFRSEAGASGRDTRGMLRQHQFYKVEMVSIAHPDDSKNELDRMTGCAEAILQRLGIPYRAMLLSSGDMGFSAQRTYDLEGWMPGQDCYREISSCSNCGDFQARRMSARYKPKQGKGTNFVHTLNGSGLAVGRTLIAVMENYQLADGGFAIPEALQPYMGGMTRIV